MNNKASNFLCAALPSVQQHVNSVLKYFPGYITNESVSNFFSNTVNSFLSSIGVVIGRNCKINQKLIDKYVKTLKSMINKEYMKKSLIYVDSGGFSIQQGYIHRENIPEFIRLYKLFVENNYFSFDRAFTLDLAPGYVHCPYKSWKDLEILNNTSYGGHSTLSEEIRSKIIYIHHFRTPRLYNIYKKMFQEYSKYFTHFGTGGLVSMSNVKNPPPVILYSVPLMDIIHHAVKSKLNKITFHALGETEFKSILTHCFFEKHVKKLYNIDLQITFDSSTIFKVVGLGRYTYMLDKKDNTIWKLGLRSESLHNIYRSGKSNEEEFYELINETVVPWNMKGVSKEIDPLYEKDGTFNKLFYTYGIFQMFKMFKDIQDLCYKIVDELYPMYESDEDVLFNQKIESWMLKFNNGIDSKRITTRTNSIYNSLKMLESMDFDYSDYLVDQYLSCEENRNLPNTH